jgi:hypothetical protein
MADAIITDVVQEHSRILTASDVVVDELVIIIRDNDLTKEGGTREDIILQMKYHQCKDDSSEGRLEQPQVDGDVEREWRLSGGDDLKELVSIVVESTNVKAIFVLDCVADTHDVIEQFLQGLCTNHTIVSARFRLICPQNTMIDVLDKSADMLCHNIGLQDFNLDLVHTEGTTKHSGFGNALKMNHTLQSLTFDFIGSSIKLDLEELVRPLIMDENAHQANSTLTALRVIGLSAMSSVGATFARMLQKNSSIKHLDLSWSSTSESDVQELIRSLVENHSLETLDLYGCDGVKGSVFPTIMDVLLVNFTLKAIKLHETPLHAKGKHLAINEQLRRNAMSKELHLKELEMAKPTSARVIFCGSPYAGTS